MVHKKKGWLAVKTAKENNTCIIFLEGEVSAQNVPELQGELDEIMAAHPGEKLVFEARDLTYISSAGLRLLLGVQKKLGNKKLVVRNVSKDVYEIFEMTKFTMLMHVEKALREIDVTDATVVGKGRSSTVYRIGDETIVKLYAAGVPLEKIKQEIDLAKKARGGAAEQGGKLHFLLAGNPDANAGVRYLHVRQPLSYLVGFCVHHGHCQAAHSLWRYHLYRLSVHSGGRASGGDFSHSLRRAHCSHVQRRLQRKRQYCHHFHSG